MMRSRDSSKTLPKSAYMCTRGYRVLKIWKLQLGRCCVIMESKRIVQFCHRFPLKLITGMRTARAGRCCTLPGLEGRVALHVLETQYLPQKGYSGGNF